MKSSLVTAVLLIACAGAASAQTVTKRLGVIAHAAGSITFTIQSFGGTASGLGTSAVTTAIGSFSKSGPVPAGYTRTVTSTKFSMTSPMGILVTKSNLTSANYTLQVRVSANTSHITWFLGTFLLSTVDQTYTTTGAYDVTQSYTFRFDINDFATPQALSRVYTFTVVSN